MSRPRVRGLLAGGGLAAALGLMLLLVPVAAWAAAGWSPQVATPAVTADLAAVDFSDSSDGWAVGAAGTILHTTDGGATWTAQAATPATTQSLAGVAFADSSDAWAVGAAGTILHTTDGGATWTAPTATPVTTSDLAGVAFANANDGWAVGAAGTILHTTNAGGLWSAQSSGTGADLKGVAFPAAKRGWVVGASGTVLATLSAGIPDVTAPVTTATGLQANGHAGWRNRSQTVALAGSDAGSGVAVTYYAVDGGVRQTYAAPFVLAAPGSH